MLKLSKINPKQASNEGSIVEIKIDGEATGATITVRGKYSDVAEKMQRAALRKTLQDYKKAGKYVPTDPDDQETERIAYAVACTIAWEGIEGKDGQPLEFTEANATALYREHKWILVQIDEAIGDDARFLKA